MSSSSPHHRTAQHGPPPPPVLNGRRCRLSRHEMAAVTDTAAPLIAAATAAATLNLSTPSSAGDGDGRNGSNSTDSGTPLTVPQTKAVLDRLWRQWFHVRDDVLVSSSSSSTSTNATTATAATASASLLIKFLPETSDHAHEDALAPAPSMCGCSSSSSRDVVFTCAPPLLPPVPKVIHGVGLFRHRLDELDRVYAPEHFFPSPYFVYSNCVAPIVGSLLSLAEMIPDSDGGSHAVTPPPPSARGAAGDTAA